MEDSLEDYIKIVRNIKEGSKKQPQQKISDKELATLQRKKQCEANAVKIVEFLIEGQLRPEVFLRCLKHINQEYYQDVVEERAISKLCGYAVCGKRIPDMPNKQYFISTKTNKVYDVTDRKNYCSNLCYKASIHIKQQIDTSPLWLRKYEENTKFDLLPSTDKGSPGEEIDQGIARIPKTHEFTSVSSFTEVSLSEIGEMEVKSKKSSKHKETGILETLSETDEVNEMSPELINSDEVCSPSKIENKIDSSSHISEASTSLTSNHKSSKQTDVKSKTSSKINNCKNSDSSMNILESIKKYVYEWITLETYIFLYGEEKIKEALNETQLQEYFKKLKETEDSITQQKKYLEICQKLHLTQLAEDKMDSNIIGMKMKPVPDYTKVKEESKVMDLKIRSFYTGVPYEIESDKSKREKEQKQTSEENVEEGPPAVLPLVETSAQTAIRRKIYLNSLDKVMVNLTQHLGVAPQYVMKDVQSLVKTFKLQANNIVFKPAVWSLIALILIKMLSVRDSSLSKQLEVKQSQTFIKVMLQQFANGETFINELLESLKDVNLFLKQYFSTSDNALK
ncbi:hypothetical protein ILUMI_03585 [Ignelater luminosus]|uniref:RNA polymerase II subunit B1 CTD phosphatase RPAP2 homolog n=1 Tax=Ignelater luminosus TaxID=2038154 RepID=A0A8K0GI67_IGNLU|nr:hypothetical protein ILUMI_03585 [Ignelater luminosus]